MIDDVRSLTKKCRKTEGGAKSWGTNETAEKERGKPGRRQPRSWAQGRAGVTVRLKRIFEGKLGDFGQGERMIAGKRRNKQEGLKKNDRGKKKGFLNRSRKHRPTTPEESYDVNPKQETSFRGRRGGVCPEETGKDGDRTRKKEKKKRKHVRRP